MTFPEVRRVALSTLALAIGGPLAAPTACAQSATGPALASVLVTATRSPQPAGEVLSDHVVITSDDILRSGAVSVIDLLQKQRGIEVSRNGGPGANASVFIRGADGKQNVVLVDGVRIGSSTSGAANWTSLPLANIERIEIVYGPLATMYGADAIGGVVQVFTRRGAGDAKVSAMASAGSERARQFEAGIAGAAGAFSYAVAAAREQDEGFSATRPTSASFNRDNDGYRRQSAGGQLAYAPASGHELGVLFLHSRLLAQYDAGASAFDARSVQDLDNVALFARSQVNSKWRISAQAARADDVSATWANGSATGYSKIETRQTSYSLMNDIVAGPGLAQLLLERREEDVISSSTRALTTGRKTDSVAASYSLRLGAHTALAGARRDDSSQYGGKLTGNVGYGYRISPALRANASAGTSFRAPTFNELYFPGFGVASNRPESGRNVEGGLVYRDGGAEATAVYYRNRISDLLVNTTRCPVEPATHPSGCAYNVNRATLSGLTLGARSRFGSYEARASMDFQDPRDETTGKQLVRRARRHASFGLDYASGPLEAGVGLQVSGRRYDDTANRNQLGGYGVVNLFAAWRFAPGWTALARWNNVADKQYELARNYATAGSQVFLGLKFGTQ